MTHPANDREPLSHLEGLDPRSSAVFGAFMRARRLHHLLMLRLLADQEAPPGQAICLRMLAAHEGATQRELGDMLHLSAPTVTAMLKRMERSGTIEREPDPADQRVARVRLTAEGRDLEQHLSSVLAEKIGGLLDGMPAADRDSLARLLRDLADRMAEAIDEPPADSASTGAPAAGTAGVSTPPRASEAARRPRPMETAR